MSDVKPIPESDIETFVHITANAFPGFGLDNDQARAKDARWLESVIADPNRGLCGLYRDGQLIGGMILLDFDMTFGKERLQAGGVGRVAVDLMHKKDKVARDMMLAFMDNFRAKGVPLLLLYPFRPDFYKDMGFGYGTKMSNYRFQPESLPQNGDKTRVRFLGSDDKGQLMSCYNRYASITHGMILRDGHELDYHLEQQTTLFAGYFNGDVLEGYVLTKFSQGATFLENNLQVLEMVYESREALLGMTAFLRTQLDQVAWISHSAHDEAFHHILSDPRNGSGNIIPPVYHESNTQGVGLMYRVIDVPLLFSRLADHNFNGQDLRLQLSISDSFIPENDGETFIHFDQGKARVIDSGESDVSITLDVAEFSSMIVGSVRFKELYKYGLAEMSSMEFLDVVDRLFRTDTKPFCLTRF